MYCTVGLFFIFKHIASRSLSLGSTTRVIKMYKYAVLQYSIVQSRSPKKKTKHKTAIYMIYPLPSSPYLVHPHLSCWCQ